MRWFSAWCNALWAPALVPEWLTRVARAAGYVGLCVALQGALMRGGWWWVATAALALPVAMCVLAWAGDLFLAVVDAFED